MLLACLTAFKPQFKSIFSLESITFDIPKDFIEKSSMKPFLGSLYSKTSD